jgi:hypothetical protein
MFHEKFPESELGGKGKQISLSRVQHKFAAIDTLLFTQRSREMKYRQNIKDNSWNNIAGATEAAVRVEFSGGLMSTNAQHESWVTT